MPFELLLIFASVAVFVVGLIAWMKFNDHRRARTLGASAEQLGLVFRREGDADLKASLSHFNLFNQGRARKLRNLVVGDAGEINIAIFDYQYTVGGGNHQATIGQTVALLESPELKIPEFTLRPESIFDKLGTVLGMQTDIDFDTHQEFSRLYLLKAADEAAVRALFHEDLIRVLEQKKRACIEAVPGRVIIYNARQRRKPAELKQFFAEALELFNLLTANVSAR